jgi:hypothetical protein
MARTLQTTSAPMHICITRLVPLYPAFCWLTGAAKVLLDHTLLKPAHALGLPVCDKGTHVVFQRCISSHRVLSHALSGPNDCRASPDPT